LQLNMMHEIVAARESWSRCPQWRGL
jgi:hypothetical protein